MPYAIQRAPDQFLCGSNTTLPRWGRLDTMTNLVVFPERADAEEFMDTCQSMIFEDTDSVVTFALA